MVSGTTEIVSELKLSPGHQQSSNLSIDDPEDAELAYTMRDLPPRTGGHTFPRDIPIKEAGSRPHTPGTPTRTSGSMGRNYLETEPEGLRRSQLSSMSSLESPMSPSRPKSPWGRYDPYDSAEVQLKPM